MKGYWKLRFDIIDNADYESYLEEISALCNRAIFYYHPDGKTDGKSPHIHGLLYDYAQSDDTLRNNTKKRFGLTGKESCTVSNTYKRGTKMSDITYQGYVVYMTKGKYDPVYKKGFSDEECQLAKSLWKDIQPTAANIVIEPREKIAPKLTLFQVSKAAITEWMVIHGDDEEVNYEEMIDLVVDILHKNGTLAHDSTVSNIIQDIQSQFDRKRFKARIMRRCMF